MASHHPANVFITNNTHGTAGGDEVFAQLVLARIVEPVSFAQDSWRQQISAACAAHAGVGPTSPVLYDCSTLYFETDEGDGSRESGFSKVPRSDTKA
jgi:hypothetical protein